MKDKTNFISANGIIKERSNDYCTLKSIRSNGKENLIRLWEVPDEIKVGMHISVEGELVSGPLCNGSPKSVLGVKVKSFSLNPNHYGKGDYEKDIAIISGEIVSKGKIMLTSLSNQKILELKVMLENSLVIPVLVWNAYAEIVFEKYEKGDKIQVTGRLSNREYVKAIDGRLENRLIMKINVNTIRKIRK